METITTYINELMTNDEDNKSKLVEALKSLNDPYTRNVIVFKGCSCSGKSTFINLLNTTTCFKDSFTFVSTDVFRDPDFLIYGTLKDKKIATFNFEDNDKLDDEKVKLLSYDKEVMERKLYQPSSKFTPTFKSLAICNEQTINISDGNNIIIVPFNNNFEDSIIHSFETTIDKQLFNIWLENIIT